MPDQQLSDLSVTHAPSEGDVVGRDPDAIQREIEETRAELARTVDLIAERLSPRRAASRGASKVRSSIDGVLHRDSGAASAAQTGGNTTTGSTGPRNVHHPAGQLGSPDYDSGIRSVPLPPSSGPEMLRTLRTDRVAIAAAAAAAVVVGVVLLIRRRAR